MNGVQLIIKEPGTVIRDETGKEYVVSDEAVVFHRSKAFLTQKTYDALKDHPDVKTKCP